MKRKIEDFENGEYYQRNKDRFICIAYAVIIFFEIIGSILGMTIAGKMSPIIHFTEKEIHYYTEIGRKIIDNKGNKSIINEVEKHADKNGYEINIDYSNATITFSFRNERKGKIIVDFSSNEDIKTIVDYDLSIRNYIIAISIGAIIGGFIAIYILNFVCRLIMKYLFSNLKFDNTDKKT